MRRSVRACVRACVRDCSGGFCAVDQGEDATFVRVCNADATVVKATLNGEQAINRAGLFAQPHGLACDGASTHRPTAQQLLLCATSD
jgi:hypothetical protein